MKKRIIITSILAIVLAGALGVYYVYNKPHRDVKGETAFVSVDAKQLFEEYSKNEAAANKKYLDKVIIVKGTVKEVILPTDNKGGATIVLESGDEMFGVSCGFDAKDSQNPAVGSTITIKGACTGMTTDVVLNKCSIQKP
ncbi:MAG: OB-fold putative lipoprotein [Raineya sp.]|jgi:hypothetical protein|nr:OB-fold putative lipoprotein [Raineya sp.]